MILSISEHIYTMLSASAELQARVGEKIFPLGTKREVESPFIVYERDNVSVDYDKEHKRTADVDVSVYVAAETYTESVEIAEIVIKALDKELATYDGFIVEDAHVMSAAEDFVDTAYVQKVGFNFIITEK